MNWADGPATWKQLRFLSHHGYKPDHVLTKSEASELVRKIGGDPNTLAGVPEKEAQPVRQEEKAYDLRLKVEHSRQAMANAGRWDMDKHRHELAIAASKREEFWLLTCPASGRVGLPSQQAQDFYQKHGCRFVAPTRQQVHYVLDALDSVMPHWDRDHPELFYQTLELNFPELVRKR